MNNNYWLNRLENLTTKNIKDTEKQLIRYYRITMNSVVNDFENTANKLLATKNKDDITIADLYKLDKYWQMQAQLNEELNKLGDKQIKLYTKQFIEQYEGIYKTIALESDIGFSTINREIVNQMINQIWCADNKSWSQRVWDNTNKLKQELNDGLIDCVVAGKKTTVLKKNLQERFKVSYHRANTIVRTEMAHLQTQASADKYKACGVEKYKVLVSPDERTCDICSQFDNKEFYLAEMQIGVNAPPFHPNCRDTIVPIIKKP